MTQSASEPCSDGQKQLTQLEASIANRSRLDRAFVAAALFWSAFSSLAIYIMIVLTALFYLKFRKAKKHAAALEDTWGSGIPASALILRQSDPYNLFQIQSDVHEPSVFSIPFTNVVTVPDGFEANTQATQKSIMQHEAGHIGKWDTAYAFAGIYVFFFFSFFLTFYASHVLIMKYETVPVTHITFTLCGVLGLITFYRTIHRREYLADMHAMKSDPMGYVNFRKRRALYEDGARAVSRWAYWFDFVFHPSARKRAGIVEGEPVESRWSSFLYAFFWSYAALSLSFSLLLPRTSFTFGLSPEDAYQPIYASIVCSMFVGWIIGRYLNEEFSFSKGCSAYVTDFIGMFLGVVGSMLYFHAAQTLFFEDGEKFITKYTYLAYLSASTTHFFVLAVLIWVSKKLRLSSVPSSLVATLVMIVPSLSGYQINQMKSQVNLDLMFRENFQDGLSMLFLYLGVQTTVILIVCIAPFVVVGMAEKLVRYVKPCAASAH